MKVGDVVVHNWMQNTLTPYAVITRISLNVYVTVRRKGRNRPDVGDGMAIDGIALSDNHILQVLDVS